MTDRRRLLTDDEVADALVTLPGWSRVGDKLHAGFSFHNFVAAFEFMTRVAELAEELDHHPEWSNVYGSVTINLTNHDAGGITELDVDMAKRIKALA
jgi:4a-hydroxytetrahydrobiopterin dehydratase